MAQDDEEVRFVGAPEVLSRWWSRISGMRKIFFIAAVSIMVTFIPLAVLTADGTWPQWVWGIWGVAHSAALIYGGITNRRDADRELNEIARSAERTPEEAAD